MPSHPTQVLFRDAVARAYGTTPGKLKIAIDGCGIETFAFPLRDVARAYAMLADPSAIPAGDPRSGLAGSLTIVRDAMLANPEMIAGRHDRIDTSLMKAMPGRLIAKGGMEALRGVAILPGARTGTSVTAATGMAVKIEDGDGYDRGTWAASVEALRQAGVIDHHALRELAHYHQPASLRPARAPVRRDDRRLRTGAGGRAHRLIGGRSTPVPRRRRATIWNHDGHRPGSVSHARARPRRLDRRDQARLSPAGQDPPPRRRRRDERAAVPGDPGGLRAARRWAGWHEWVPAAVGRASAAVGGGSGSE